MRSERLFCFYGDDFTGSTDALEALASNGLSAVLFLQPPTDEMLARFPECRAVGVAGDSRSRDPKWMSAHLPAIFSRLAELHPRIFQYKVCSTFDSSPETGSIGRAIEIGQEVFRTSWTPVVVAAPHLGRYVLFGNLFAAGGGEVHRIDRHPTMRQHPVTPMQEGDLRLHLGRQTSRRIELLNILLLTGKDADAQLQKLLDGSPAAVLFDGLDECTQRNTARLLGSRAAPESLFAVGSSGLIQALAQHWAASGELLPKIVTHQPKPVERLLIASGSCSPVTARQIGWAVQHGFTGIKIDVSQSDDSSVLSGALTALSDGKSVILYTALGGGDKNQEVGGEKLGYRLGLLLRDLLIRSGVSRAVVAGGDTSSYAVRQLGIEALTYAGRTTPGAPLCQCHAPGSALDRLELVLKGGQMGPENFFHIVRDNNA